MKATQAHPIDFAALEQTLPANYQEKAYECGAFKRARKIRSPAQLLQLIMTYCGLDYSARTCAGTLSHNQGYISDMGVLKRLRCSVVWLKMLVTDLFAVNNVNLPKGLRFLAIDGSTIQEPGAKGMTYRLHLAIEINSLNIHEATVTTDKTGESLDRYQLQPGDVVLADRGYNEPKAIIPWVQKGIHIMMRYNANGMPLYIEEKVVRKTGDEADTSLTKIKWVKKIAKAKQVPFHICVVLKHKNEQINAYLHAYPLPRKQAAEARRKARTEAAKKGRQLSQAELKLKGWVLVLTTLPPDVLDTETVAELYQVRWQIELVFKRLKSILKLDQLRARKGSQLAETYLYGKLLYALIIEKLARRLYPINGMTLDAARDLTPWRLWTQVKSHIVTALMIIFPPYDEHLEVATKSLRERPRKRSLQQLPLALIPLLA